MHGLGWVALWLIPVFAQPAPEDDPLPPETPAVQEDPIPRASLRMDTHSWYDAVPADADTRVFMGIAAVGPRGLAIDGGGGVWRTEDAGQRWRLVLNPLVQIAGPADLDPARLDYRPSETLLDYRAQDLADELSDDYDDFETDYDSDYDADSYGEGGVDSTDDDAEDDDGDSTDDTDVDADSLEAELSQQIQLEGLLSDARAAGLREAAMRLGGQVFLHPDLPDLALVGRADGIWRSIDGGRDWTQVDPLSTVTVFAAGPGALLYAGSDDGLRYSVDQGRTWIDKDDPMDGQRVRDLVVAGDGTWWCGTDQGLFRSDDAENWETAPVSGLRSPGIFALLPEPGAPGSLLLADNETLYRTADRGETVVVLGRQPLLDTTRLLALSAAGHLLASGSDGVWETVDGGLTWHPLYRGLSEPQVFDLALLDDRLHAVTLAGLLRLAERQPAAEPGETPIAWAAAPTGETPPQLEDIVWATTTRQGIDPAIYSQGRLKRTRALPEVVLAGRCGFGRGLTTDFSSPPTTADRDRDCAVMVSLVFLKPSQYTDSDVVVVDGSVYTDVGLGAVPVVAAKNARHMNDYRYAIIDLVIELYMTREQLLERFADIPPDDLRAQVMHVLQIQEVTARLDAYTDGAFTRGTISLESP